MNFWLRSAVLIIGQNKYSLDNMHFGFKIEAEDRATVSKAEFKIYNLSKTNRNSLKKGDPVILSAGYRDDIGCIFVGTISDVSHSDNGIDTITSITAADSLNQWLGINVNKTYKGGMRASQIIADLLNVFGVEVSAVKLAEDKLYTGCRVCTGKLKDVLASIVVNDCKSQIIIRTGQLVIIPPSEGISKGYLLTPQTGLLKSEKTSQNSTIGSGDGKSDEINTITRVCLLNYHIGIGDRLSVQDSQTNGIYTVKSIQHEGEYGGGWKTTMELIPA